MRVQKYFVDINLENLVTKIMHIFGALYSYLHQYHNTSIIKNNDAYQKFVANL